MKQYKKNNLNGLYNKNKKKFYELSTIIHGYYYSSSNNSFFHDYIGFFNMGEEYGHWKNGRTIFNYYL